MSEVLLQDRPVSIEYLPPLPMPSPFQVDICCQFRGFYVEARNRVLKCNGHAVELGSRAFDLLIVLLQTRGTVVTKRQIMQEVWPSTLVDDSNLRFQMACLRRALGADRDVIKTIQGRGYFFVADVVCLTERNRPAPRSDPRQRIPLPASHDGPALVAVVDDDENTRDALDSFLRSSGFIVETYISPREFMDARLSDVECLILDVWLPGQSGLEFQSELKAAGAKVPIVFISGHADVHMSVKAMKAGAVEFLTKPVRHHELLDAIQAAIAARRKQVQLV